MLTQLHYGGVANKWVLQEAQPCSAIIAHTSDVCSCSMGTWTRRLEWCQLMPLGLRGGNQQPVDHAGMASMLASSS